MGEKFILTFYKGRAIQIPYTTPIKKDFDLASLAEENGISLSDIDMEELSIGLEEELEHSDVTGGELKPTFQIVVAHLKEDPKYYSKLEEAGLVAKGGPGSGRKPEGKSIGDDELVAMQVKASREGDMKTWREINSIRAKRING